MPKTHVSRAKCVTVETEHLKTVFEPTTEAAALEIGLLQRRILELEKALESIIKHQAMIGGELAQHSATFRIAFDALHPPQPEGGNDERYEGIDSGL